MPLISVNANWTFGTYIAFLDLGPVPSGKTRRYEIWSKDEDHKLGSKLGEVRWFGRFRKYSLFPVADTVFEETCLSEIIDFLRQQTRLHREQKAAEKRGLK